MLFMYVVCEYCFDDNKSFAERNILGSYETMGEARKAAGEYIKLNVKRKKAKYRHWQVDVHKERVFFPIKGIDIRENHNDSKIMIKGDTDERIEQ